jgi:photosystem II stability/assembly factor-like uncharacterized protein
VKLLDSEGKNLLVSSRNKIYYSSDTGFSWEKLFELPLNYLITDIIFTADSSILCGDQNPSIRELYRYDLKNKCLMKVLDDAAESHPLMSTESDSVFFAAGYRGNIYRSIDFGKVWTLIAKYHSNDSSYYPNYYVCSGNSCIVSGHRRFICGFVTPGEILLSDDTGRTWRVGSNPSEIKEGPLPQISEGTRKGEFFCCSNTDFSGKDNYAVLHSTNFGETWTLIKSPPDLWSIVVDKAKRNHCLLGCFKVDKRYIEKSPVYESYNGGKNWRGVGNLPSSYVWNLAINDKGTKVFAATAEGLFTYTYKK